MKLGGKEWAVILALCILAAGTVGYFLGQGETQVAVSPGITVQAPANIPESSGVDIVNLNTATLAQLMKLPGIGEVLAERILAWRAENGPFLYTKQLLEVEGIGQSKYDDIKFSVTVQ